MGFFSSRRAEPAPLPRSSQQSSHSAITSKWYGKLRTKSTRTADQTQQSPEISVSAAFQPGPSSRPVSLADPTTVDLATRLNDLATSHADGLISDDEYRILRQNIFERFGATNPVIPSSTLSGTQRTARGPQTSARSPIPSYSPPESASRMSGSQPPSPLSSVRSSLRRIGSRSSNNASIIPPPDSPVSSLFSFRSRTTVTTGQGGGLNMSTHTLLSQPSGGLNRPADLLSVSSHRSKISVAPSHKSRGPPPSSFVHHPMPGTSVRQTVPDNEAEKTAAQLRRELAEVEKEGRRVLEGFDALEAKLLEQAEGLGLGIRFPSGSSHYPAGPPSPATVRPKKRNSLVDMVSLRSPAKSSTPAALNSPPSPYTTSIQTAAVLDAIQPDPALEANLDEVRRGRADVRQRYDARIAFLRAKLRGAELHEKLMR